VRGLPGEVGVVVTCRTQEYEQLLAAHATGLGLVQAVEILPLTSEQLDSALTELAKVDEDWEAFLSQRNLTAYKRVRHLMSNPLFLNLAVVGHLSPEQLLDATTTEQDLRDLVFESYLDSTLAEQRPYEPQDARRYLSWIARFLNGDAVSPFGLKTSDYTVFDLADLTPPEPPRRYRLFEGLLYGLVFGLVFWPPGWGLLGGLGGLLGGLFFGLVVALPTGWPFKRSAVSSRLTLASWPSTRRQLLAFLRRAGRGLFFGLVYGLGAGLVFGLRNGGWFVLLQKVAHRRLARAANLPSPPYDFLDWGIEKQIFRRVGGGVRFRHNLIQQHLASTSADAGE
jgi:hypothetical protein